KVDGRAGLFKGLAPRLCSSAIGTVVHSKVLQCSDGGGTGGGCFLPDASSAHQPETARTKPVSSLEQVLKETSREMVARSAATLITYPFHVITLRCMVQFIGRETKYSGTLSAFATIYREEGILGFFAGLIPRLLGDILSLWLCNMLAYLINTYALENGVRALCPALREGWGGRGDRASPWGGSTAPRGLKVPFCPSSLQVSTMTEMKSYSQAFTG
ncbi:MTCH2 protein, partial [Heliornis fulica]|nr:MTCH2 protein [Heliornis fulica]